MSHLLNLLTDARFVTLVLALLHTLWMGAVAAGALALLLRWLPASIGTLRYSLSLVALGAIVLGAGIMWVGLDRTAGHSLTVRIETENNVQGGATQGASRVEPLRTPSSATPREETSSAGALVPAGRAWLPCLGAIWMIGVAMMLMRTAYAVRQAGQLVRRGVPAEPSALALVDCLRKELGMVRRVRVVVSRMCSSPAVAGVLWPTLVLPVSFLTELPPDAIRAIVLHELAHVRRHDYLINLVQMLIEAVLFFNPAVWWISRQVRMEREACCDAMAVRTSGQPVEYSQALADWARRLQLASPSAEPPSAAMAVASRGQPLLLDRIRRVLFPFERPAAHLTPRSLGGFALLALLTIGLLWQGPWVVVAVAEQLLTPAERIEQVAELVEAHSPSRRSEGDVPVTLAGKLRTEDGQPLPKRVMAHSQTRNENINGISTEGYVKENFEVTVSPGVIWLVFQAEGYGPGVAGPFNGEPGKVIDDIEVVFPKGFPAEFVVTDDAGDPVAGATLSAGLILGEGSSFALKGEADHRGKGTLSHAIEGEYFISARAPGFQNVPSDRQTIRRGEPLVVSLKRSQPVTGEVVTVDGQPISGAKLQAFVTQEGEDSHSVHGPVGEELGVSDVEGRFVLAELVNGKVYHVMVFHPDHGRRVIEDLQPGDRDLRIELGPNWTIEGTVLGDLSGLPQRWGKPYVNVRQSVPVGTPVRVGWYGDTATVESTEDGGRFVLAGLLPAETFVTAGEHQVKLQLSQPRQQVVIDLNEPIPTTEKRQVELTFEAVEGALPRGSVKIVSTTPERRAFGHSQQISLSEEGARFEMPVGVEVRVEPQGLIGYWFKDATFTVTRGAEPQKIRIETIPAGAISGRVVLPDGTPASDASIRIRVIETPKGMNAGWIPNSVNPRVDAKGMVVVTPLPLDATYVVIAGRKFNNAMSEPVRLTRDRPTASVEIEFSPETSASGRVLGPDGQPLADIPLKLQLEHPIARMGWGPPFVTDGKGRFELQGLSSTLGGYKVWLSTNKKYQPASAELDPGGGPATLHLKEGHVLEGRVVDTATGKPIAGVELYAVATQRMPDEPYAYEAEGKTAKDGSFRFSNLALQPYRINDRNGLKWDKELASDVAPEETKELLIEATLPEWSTLRVGD